MTDFAGTMADPLKKMFEKEVVDRKPVEQQPERLEVPGARPSAAARRKQLAMSKGIAQT